MSRAAAIALVVIASNSVSRFVAAASPNDRLPVRGLHLGAPTKDQVAKMAEFIRTVLPKEGINTLVLEFDYNYNFQSRREFSDAKLIGRSDAQQLVAACRDAGVQLIPQINCLGHQSWAKHTDRLLALHPEFDETAGKYPNNEGIYCRSYCPLHPGLHAVLFDLIDELARDCEAKAFHIGMDEVFILADKDCPRCHGKSTADLFAGEVTRLDEHIKRSGRTMWMWGDRFIDGRATKLGEWEASENNTESAIDHVPKDIVICDWHYDSAPDTPRYFAEKGFPVIICPWRKTDVALKELEMMRALRTDSHNEISRNALGVMETTWSGFGRFSEAYEAAQKGKEIENKSGRETVNCFLTLTKALRTPAE